MSFTETPRKKLLKLHFAILLDTPIESYSNIETTVLVFSIPGDTEKLVPLFKTFVLQLRDTYPERNVLLHRLSGQFHLFSTRKR